MKDSGIKWIGNMPSSWKIIRLKHASWLKGRIGWQGLRADEFIEDEKCPYLITGTDFDEGFINWKTCVHITNERYLQDLAIHIQENDLLITKDGTIGKVAIAKNCPEKVSLNSGVFIIRNTGKYKYHDRYMYYLIQSDQFLKWYDLSNAGNSTIKHLNQEKFYNFKFTYPDVEEQIKIANYLDDKCNEIDSIIKDEKQQIEILEEYKKSIITETVTKGLNPAVEMKDSGIKWIGKIPNSWEVDKIKYHLKRNEPKNPGDKELLSVYRDYGVIPKDSRNDNYNVASEDKSNYKYVKKGNLVINKMKAWQGSLAVSDYEGIVSPAYFIYKFTDNRFESKYFHYLIRSCYKNEFRRLSGGIREGQWDLSAHAFENTLVLIPSMLEQQQIIKYLDEKCNEIDSIIADKKQQLETLEQYKKSLIYEYVTGKKEVTDNE